MKHDRIALSHRTAVLIGFDTGVINELNMKTTYDKMCANLTQPTKGYFYADDVQDFLADEVREALAS